MNQNNSNTQKQNVETSNVKTGSEYVLVNGQDLYDVDYDEQTATLREDVTLEDLEVNNHEYTDLEEISLYEYLENNGYIVNEGTEEKVFFVKGVDQ
jgi:hypothetical protein